MTHPYTRLFFLPAPPDADNDISEGYEVGDVVHVSVGSVFDCRDNTEAAAVWEERTGGGGAPEWGDITGTLSDQTDLQTALNGKSGTGHTHEVDQRADIFNDAEGTGIPSPIGSSSDGSSTYAARRDHVHDMVRGSAVLGADFNITGATGVFQDTGLSLSLPGAGTYLITGSLRG